MATSKLRITSPLLRVNSALKKHLANIGKQQFALWKPRLCPEVDGEAQQASLNGVDSARLWRTSEGVTLSIAMATGKLQSSSLVLGLNLALKENLGDFGKQQFTLWQLPLCSKHHGEGRQAPVNDVDSGTLLRTLTAGERTFH